MYWLALLIVGIISSLIFNPWFNSKSGKTYAEKLNNIYGTYWSALIAHLIGAWGGGTYLGKWGWMIADYNVIGGFIGAIIIGYIWFLIAKGQSKAEANK
ncbi:MAG: hypothetical protein ACPL3A_09415 [Thermoanaerobacteraceae bacterium]